MKTLTIKHDLSPGTGVRLTRSVPRRDVATRKLVTLECGWDLEVLGPDGEYGGVPQYRVRDSQGRVWRGILAAWVEPVGGPAAGGDNLFD